MDLLAPVSTIMTSNLHTVTPKDSLKTVKEIFDQHRIHHIPVVKYKEMVGIISKTDFLHFLRGYTNNVTDEFINDSRLNAYHAEDIMTTGLARVESTDRINVVLEVFKENLFHAVPVVDDGELVGIVTTFDIIKKLAEQG